jgi:hypothetical protein
MTRPMVASLPDEEAAVAEAGRFRFGWRRVGWRETTSACSGLAGVAVEDMVEAAEESAAAWRGRARVGF